ncbi:MAG: hypothetical protein A2Y92_01475 [Chloroflexi bacterium RBG_13_57_8]|nr:MAG: hypothetical protein A2Y92_01475 [Chloroflexi bacterium RBG_13_57_8]
MFNKIIVPLDTSELSEIALPYAEEMAVKLGAELILMHVGTPADSMDKPLKHKNYIDKVTARVERQLKKSVAKVKLSSRLLEMPSLIVNPAADIIDFAESEKVDLIIMATHGRTGLSRWALGSTANKVARAVKCPLFLIRAGAKKPARVSLENILVTLDGSKPGEAVLPYIENLAKRLQSRVTLLHVVELLYHVYPYSEGMGYYGSAGVVRVPYTEEEMQASKDVAEKYIKDVNDKLASRGVKTGYKIMMGSPGEEIIKAEAKMRPDFVVMSTHGHSGFGRWEHGSIADKVLHAGTTPLLLVRPQQPGKTKKT